MDLVKYKNLSLQIPIKSIPEEKLNTIIVDEFIEWLSSLLSLTDELSAQRLETALPAVKEHCWSMGFNEISKMFEMYVDNKLSIEPIPNYFDRILFGKIVQAYKNLKRSSNQSTQVTKEDENYHFVVSAYDHYISTGHLENEVGLFLYKYLVDGKKLIEFDKETKITELEIKSEEIQDKSEAITASKISLLSKYFNKMKARGLHIKLLLNESKQ